MEDTPPLTDAERIERRTKILHDICMRHGVNPKTLEATVRLAVEIAREGREGRKIGTLFVVSDSETVLKHSRCLILDPLYGHPPEHKKIFDPNVAETIKEIAQMDGAFIIADDGVVVSACRYIDTSSEGIELPLGFGSRHMAAASITLRTKAVAVVVSESAIVRIFDDGELMTEIIPELWILRQHGVAPLGAKTEERTDADLTVISKREDD